MRYRRYPNLELVALHDLDAEPLGNGETRWTAIGADPQFALTGAQMPLRPGMYELRFTSFEGVEGLSEPIVYFDTGEGLSEREIRLLRFERQNDRSVAAYFELPADTYSLRFDPSNTPCRFTIGECSLVRISTSLLRARRLVRAIRLRVRKPSDVLKIAGMVLRHYRYGGWRAVGALANRAYGYAETTSSQTYIAEPLSPFDSWQEVNLLTERDIDAIRSRLSQFDGALNDISILVPLYNTPLNSARELLNSVKEQLYDRWQLCICDDGSSDLSAYDFFRAEACLDDRIKVVRQEKNAGISEATNRAAELAEGEILLLLDHDDLLKKDCLAEVALYYGENPEADIVYSDDDKFDLSGSHFSPQFKPDWSPILLLSYMYLGHVATLRRSLYLQVGGCRKRFDGAQDYDLFLRAAEHARHVGHIPKILYHWRVVPGSTALSGAEKPSSFEAGRKAVEDALNRRGINGQVYHPSWAKTANYGIFSIRFPDDGPLVSIIIPTKDNVDFLRRCVDSIGITKYKNYEIIVVDNESEQAATISYLDRLEADRRARVLRFKSKAGKFNFSNLNNRAVKDAKGEFVLFLNNDTEVISPEWLGQMVGYSAMPNVGAVGARLLFGDQTIQHAGVIHVGRSQLPEVAFRHVGRDSGGYLSFSKVAREYSAVTAACLLTPRALFQEFGGFDESKFAVAYNDVDYCYRLVKAGKYCVFCADAELFHYEGKSRGYKDAPSEERAYRDTYGDWRDRWYNPNLSSDREHLFEPARSRPIADIGRPVSALFVSHNLEREGATNVLKDLVLGLREVGGIDVSVFSLDDGPLRGEYEESTVGVSVFESLRPSLAAEGEMTRSIEEISQLLGDMAPDVIIANTLVSWWVVYAAHLAGIPVIWCQHESEPWQSYYDYLPPFAREVAYASFRDCYRVTYVANATKRAWEPLNVANNFEVVPHAMRWDDLHTKLKTHDRSVSREKLGLSEDEVAILIMGTVCWRKGQIDLVDALTCLPKSVAEKVRIYIVGKDGGDGYQTELIERMNGLPTFVRGRVVLYGETDDPFLFYSAADVFACTSRIESAPRVLVEAMAAGLPIVTTPVFGIVELVRPDLNAIFYEPGRTEQLAGAIKQLVEDRQKRSEMSANSRLVLDSKPTYEDMIARYEVLIKQASSLNTRH